MAGWIKLHRKLLDSSIFQNADLLKFWIWCLIKSSHKEHETRVGINEITLKKGQFIFGRDAAAIELKMKPTTVYKYLKLLEKENKISVKSNNKFSLVTVEKWECYQQDDDEHDNNMTTKEQQRDNNVTTKEQQRDTNKNGKKGENEKNVKNDKNIYEGVPAELLDSLKAFEEMRKKIKAPLTDKARTMLLTKLNKLSNGDMQKSIDILNESTTNCWKGIYGLKDQQTQNTSKSFLDIDF